MDELAFHPYPSRDGDSPDVGYIWPNAGIPNLDRIKQAVWDAFHGTAQSTFAEPGVTTFTRPLMFELDEVGWQVDDPGRPLAALLRHRDLSLDDQRATPGAVLQRRDRLAGLRSPVRALNFFHLMDEPNLNRWQSGLERVDLTPRPSYEAVEADRQGHRREVRGDAGEVEPHAPRSWARGPRSVSEPRHHLEEMELPGQRGRAGDLPRRDLPGHRRQEGDRQAPHLRPAGRAPDQQGHDRGEERGRRVPGLDPQARPLRFGSAWSRR